jgi:predicted SpoU family rRNA methylase
VLQAARDVRRRFRRGHAEFRDVFRRIHLCQFAPAAGAARVILSHDTSNAGSISIARASFSGRFSVSGLCRAPAFFP